MSCPPPWPSQAPRGALPAEVTNPDDLRLALETQGYLADGATATACYLALALRKPLFLEGAAGVGKTSIAHTLARMLAVPLIRLQCYEGIDADQALYEWDFPRQLLHLRAANERSDATGEVEASLYDWRFLLRRPVLEAVELSDAVLLIDEIDRADDEFEAFLLETLSDFTVSIPELGTITADPPPIVVLTSNRTREVHDALKRRCYYLWLDLPSVEREVAILRTRLPDVPARLARQVVDATQRLRDVDLLKPPGIAETLDWAEVLATLDATALSPTVAVRTLGAVVKHWEDHERVTDLIHAGAIPLGDAGDG